VAVFTGVVTAALAGQPRRRTSPYSVMTLFAPKATRGNSQFTQLIPDSLLTDATQRPQPASRFKDTVRGTGISCSETWDESSRRAARYVNCARLKHVEDLIVYFIVITQLVATSALLVGHLAVIVKNQFARAR